MTTAVTLAGGSAAEARRATGLALLGLAFAVVIRAAMLRSPFLPAGMDGVVFAVLLAATVTATRAAAGSSRNGRRHGTEARIADLGGPGPAAMSRAPALVIGIIGGAVLVAVPLAVRGLAPAAASLGPLRGIPVGFGLWVVVTLLVSVAEELLLRGALFDVASSAIGVSATLFLTSGAFALMHVPFYGWSVVPLDFAVGLWLGGLRLVTGRVSAPAAAHALADLAALWL